MAPRGRRDVLDADLSFDMGRLFDPYNFDHIPKEDRLALFKQRDLPHVKHYKAAVKIFGGPHTRTRVIVAPPMETPLKHRLGNYHNVQVPPPAPVLNGPLKPPPEPVKEPSKEEVAKQKEDEKVANYKSWVEKRKKLRGELDNLGLSEAFLARKTDKTELEKRVQAKYKADRLWKPESPPPPEVIPPPKPLPDVPSVAVPPPDGLQILDRFLSLNRMRLMDLFLIADKDKSWSLSRQEFLNAISQSEIPLCESEVDDIILTLNRNLVDELSYKDLNKGLTQWRKHRRDVKRQGGGEEKLPTPVNSAGSKGRQIKPSSSDEENGSKAFTSDQNSENKTQSRESKEPKAVSQEGREKITFAEKSTKSTPMQTPRARISRESSKKGQSLGTLSRERTGSGTRMEQAPNFTPSREASDLETPRRSTRDGKTSQNLADGDVESEQQVATSNLMLSRENTSADKSAGDGLQSESQYDHSVYEDMLFQSEDTHRAATVTAQDIGEEEDTEYTGDGQSSKQRASDKPMRPGSTKYSSGSRSRTSTPNSLEPPEPDLRQEARQPESAEALLDMRKHDQVVLSRNNVRRSLSREQRVMFDEIDGVIKVGYKPIDDHCSESTLGGEVAGMVNQFRREKLKEYFEVKRIFEERGLPFTQKVLDRVLLYPGDKPTNALRKNIILPLGPLTNELSPFNQPKPKKRGKKTPRRSMGRISRASGAGYTSGSGSDTAGPGAGGRNKGTARGGKGGAVGGGLAGRIGGGAASRTGGGGGGRSGGYGDDERDGSGGSKRGGYLTVEDVYPPASVVAPKVYKENLSSGRALITRKVDNWMTFEEYNKYTQHLANKFQHLNRKSNPDAAWPGYVLDKVRMVMDEDLGPLVDGRGRPLENRDSAAYEGYGMGMYNGRGNAVFRHTSQPKRAYPGYNNDLLTWPVGENGVRYGNIDEHRLVK